jgi:hypothetical protein
VSSEKQVHLGEDQLLGAIVDEGDLPSTIRDHLARCPRCLANKEKLEQNLMTLGRMAEIYSPMPRRTVSLPSIISNDGNRLWKGWRICFGTALAAALAAVVVFWPGLEGPGHKDKIDMVAMETWEEEGFMTEINTLVDNALPAVYLDISGEGDTRLDDEFMQFIVPTAESESVSHQTLKGGVELC